MLHASDRLLALGFVDVVAALIALLWSFGLAIRFAASKLPSMRTPLPRVAIAAALAMVAIGVGTGAGWYVVTQDLAIAWPPRWDIVTATVAAPLDIGIIGSLPALHAWPALALRDLQRHVTLLAGRQRR